MTDSVRVHYQEELAKLEARALDGLELGELLLVVKPSLVGHQPTFPVT